jgi:RecG-like helicase
MLLKNNLIEVFKKASIDNNLLLKENIVLKWVHRFGIDSLNDLLIHSPVIIENQEQISLIDEVNVEENQEQISLIDEVNVEENQEQISLIDEVNVEENQEQISLIDEVNVEENQEEKKWELTDLQTSRSNEKITKNQDSDKIKKYTKTQKSPLPYIKNLRKWINKDKKVS